MKRQGKLIGEVATRPTLAIAFARASRGRRNSTTVRRFASDLDGRLGTLAHQLLDGSIAVGDYREFTIYDPKRRVIRAVPFEQRVVHHALMHVCGPVFERVASPHSHACRPGRGNQSALQVARRNAVLRRYFLKMDVRRYFNSISHSILKVLLRRLFKDPDVLRLFERIIDSHSVEPGRGLPIGTLTSQYFANHYLDGMDRWIVEVLGFKCYVRFMDDFVLWSDNQAKLVAARDAILAWLPAERALEAKPGGRIGASVDGLPFLGFRVVPGRLLLGGRARRRFCERLRAVTARARAGTLDPAGLQRRVGALIAHTDAADCLSWRRRVVADVGLEDLL